ncbi:TraR/DksA family transcriptional regulator [Ramlibacter tataouinensis]|uniref:TraR/DksA family transcriptional regulator n=1 Tax=Ramlibacter tataouinensis TaxID=94132 RepID=UPI0002FDE878|nr:TraR/DksA family transcriptional regulator [Ramlibacter tataouinensis]
MEDLNDEQRTQLERALSQREVELLDAIGRLRAAIASPAAGMGPEVRDSVEDGDARMMSTLDLTQLGRQEQELGEVQQARQRMRDGRYGLCEECEEPIPFARLQVRPAARFCLRHEEAWEKANPQPVPATS